MTAERLRELREAILWNDPLSESQRLELLGVLDYLSTQRARGRPADQALRNRAGVVGVLRDRHGLPLKVAIYAAAPDASEREHESVKRTYHALRSSGEAVRVPERLVRDALARLGRK